MGKQLFLTLLLVLCLVSIAHAQHQEGWIDEYRGVLGDNIRIGMSITMTGKDISGEYFYLQWLKDIPLKGKVDGRNIVLNEFDEKGQIVAVFNGRFLDRASEYGNQDIKYEVIEGTWSRPDGSHKKPFRVVMESSSYHSPGRGRYYDAGFEDDGGVEKFAQDIRKAIIERNKDKVASVVSYPITVNIGGKDLKIKDRRTFIKHYDQIFYKTFYEKIKERYYLYLRNKSNFNQKYFNVNILRIDK